MFCHQCEQNAGGKGCRRVGVCGKDETAAGCMDELIQECLGLSRYARRAAAFGATDRVIDRFVVEALFTTVTNVNFDSARLESWVHRARELNPQARSLYEEAARRAGRRPESLPPSTREVSVAKKLEKLGADVSGLQDLILYGLKGMAAYMDHARILGVEDDEVYAFVHEGLDFLAGDPKDVGALTAMALKVGEVNLKAMELLDRANTGTYGHPEPTAVRVTPVKGKCILVSGHDLKDLDTLLQQTEGKGINVYTHGEMLPCLAYPGLKKYRHLVGNYGGAWQDQQKEFEAFPGAILMTTNCIQKPREAYQARIFTTGLVGWPGVSHVPNGDFSAVISAALAAPGFAEDAPEKTITIGFARNAVMGVAGKVVEAVQAGKLRHFFLIGGCDGAKPGRNYYTELAEAVPKDCAILTLACGKYRFNKLEFGDIGGIPRLLDVGQCNDSYSAIQIALALAKAFKCGVNDLPLSIVLSWYEQKAVCVLLTLLHLGLKNMRLGPTLPAFVGPGVLKVLVEKFGLKPTGKAQDDLEEMLEARTAA
ncbi:MAG TPA: hydroxylamine reductase [Elusimicrobia bacterium]|nr:hydroxylamine reductase [Elusimicrobiota bacterium]